MPVTFDNYSAGGQGGGYVSSITRNESTTAKTPTTATCNSVLMQSVVSAKDGDKGSA